MKWKRLTKSPGIESFYRKNVALKTGATNQIMVIDIDIPKPNRNEMDGMKWYEDLITVHGELNTPICRTQSGGIHLYFKYDKDIKTTTFVNGYSIDIRAQGAYVVCPDSMGVNGPYTWKDGCSILNVMPMMIPKWLKDWLLEHQNRECAKTRAKSEKAERIKQGKPAKPYVKSDYVSIYQDQEIVDMLDRLSGEDGVDRKYLDSYSDWICITSCLKSEGLRLKAIWDTWSKKSRKYNEQKNNKIWAELNPKIDINYLPWLLGMKPFKATKYVKELTAKPDDVINERYVTVESIRKTSPGKGSRCLLIKSPCGTGKTTFTSNWIKSIKRKGTYYRTLSLTCRRTLAYEQKADMKDMDLYSDMKSDDLNNTDNLIIQIDSLHKLDISHWGRNTIVYLDEMSTLLSHMMASKTMKEKRNAIYRKLCAILKGASYIIGTDADLNDMCLRLFKGLGISHHLVVNAYRGKSIPAYSYSNFEHLISKMESELLAGEDVFATFDSKRQMEIVVQRLKHYCEDNNLPEQLDKFLVYSSTQGDKEDMLNVSKKWKGKNVFFTPCITVGVSYVDQMARKVYLFSDACSVNSCTLIQMICRCRNMIELHYYVKSRYQNLRYGSIDGVRKYYADMIKSYDTVFGKDDKDSGAADDKDDSAEFHGSGSDCEIIQALDQTGQIVYNYELGESVVRKDLFNDLYYENAYYDRVLRSATREQFNRLLEEKNFTILNAQEIPVTTETDKVVKTAKIVKTAKVVKTPKAVKAVKAVKTTKAIKAAQTVKPRTAKQKIDRAKETLQTEHENKVRRALYDSHLTLSADEKEMRADMKTKAQIVGINFSHDGQKRKYHKYISDEKAFNAYICYSLLQQTEDDINGKACTELEKNGKINSLNSMITKVKLIKRLESSLDVQCLDLDSERDKNRFNEKLELDCDLKKMVVRVFRITRKSDVDDGMYEYWYRKLGSLYRGLLGVDIVKFEIKRVKYVKVSHIKMNEELLTEYDELYKSKPDYRIDQRIV